MTTFILSVKVWSFFLFGKNGHFYHEKNMATFLHLVSTFFNQRKYGNFIPTSKYMFTILIRKNMATFFISIKYGKVSFISKPHQDAYTN